MKNLRTLKLFMGVAMLVLAASLGNLSGRAQKEGASNILSETLFEQELFGHTTAKLGDESANLGLVLQFLGLDNPDSSFLGADQLKVLKGALNFFLPFPGGNGRSCAPCHNPKDGFSLSPDTVEARWRKLQQARRHDPSADDPLFRSIDADDGEADFTLLRTGALVKVRVSLPNRKAL